MILLQPMVREPYTAKSGVRRDKEKMSSVAPRQCDAGTYSSFFLILYLSGYLFMSRVFLLLCLLVPMFSTLSGCGGSPSTSVTSEEVKRDPSLGDAYYDQEQYDKAIKGDAK